MQIYLRDYESIKIQSPVITDGNCSDRTDAVAVLVTYKVYGESRKVLECSMYLVYGGCESQG
jgi:hypothetical protein